MRTSFYKDLAILVVFDAAIANADSRIPMVARMSAAQPHEV